MPERDGDGRQLRVHRLIVGLCCPHTHWSPAVIEPINDIASGYANKDAKVLFVHTVLPLLNTYSRLLLYNSVWKPLRPALHPNPQSPETLVKSSGTLMPFSIGAALGAALIPQNPRLMDGSLRIPASPRPKPSKTNNE